METPRAEPSDEVLLDRFRKGDRDAFEVLYARHAPTLLRFAKRRFPARLRRRVSVADVVQEAQLAAFESLEGFESRGPHSFRRWLLRIVELRIREALRRHGAGRRSIQREATRGARPETAQLPGVGPTPSEVAIGAETAVLARRAMAALPSHYREVLVENRERHRTLREIAEATGRSHEAVKKLYGRALSAFREEFERLRGERLD